MDIGHWIERALCRVPAGPRHALRLLSASVERWLDRGGPQHGASIAFYTMFSLAPWLVLTIALAAMVFGADAARGQIVGEIKGLVGTDAARAVEAMVAAAWREGTTLWATLAGVATLLVGATGVFVQLRRALNAMGGLESHAHGPVIGSFVRVRLTGFALLLGFGFLTVASLLLNAGVTAFGHYLGRLWPTLALLARLAEWLLSAALLGVAFAALLRWLPDHPPSRRGLLISAAVAAVLFTLGKHVIGLYLGRATVASSYGAAGSFVVVMLWVYYASQIMLFGAACGYADEALQREADPCAEADHGAEAPRAAHLT